jgi:hypothetical protein
MNRKRKIITKNGTVMWYCNDNQPNVLHRLYAPAVIWGEGGDTSFHIQGKRVLNVNSRVPAWAHPWPRSEDSPPPARRPGL